MTKKKLNAQQQKAANHKDGPALVTSVPGSGKTTMLVERTLNLIQSGIDPKKLLCITFTNKAADEMKARVAKRLGMKRLPFFVGTFHALCANILRSFATDAGYSKSFSIIDSDDQKELVIRSARQFDMNLKKQKEDIQKIIFHLNDSREQYESRDKFEDRFEDDPELLLVASAYLENLKRDNVVDFSGLLYETVKLLDDNDALLKKLQKRFQYIQVDEAQDTNLIQFEFINRLASDHKNVMLIGDLSQSIYRFRGARYQNILDFQKIYGSEDIPLEQNYRSTPEIVKVSDNLIRHNKSHMDIEFKTDNPSGQIPQVIEMNDQDEEAQEVARKIKYYIENEGWDPEDIAVFYRVNRLSMDLQLTFSRYNVPFKVIGGPSFFDRAEIKDSVAMLRFLVNNNDTLSFSRVAGMLDGVGARSINAIEEISRKNKISLLDACVDIDKHTTKKVVKRAAGLIKDSFDFDYSNMNASDALDIVTQNLQYTTFLEKKYDHLGAMERDDNVETFKVNAAKYAEHNSPSIEAYLNNISLLTSNDQSSKQGSVSMMSVHASKGLEFPVVFIIGMEEDIMPHSRAMAEAEGEEEIREALEEERRICYVAFTRAMRRLIVTHCEWRQQRGPEGQLKYSPRKPSRFLFESGLLRKKLKDKKNDEDF